MTQSAYFRATRERLGFSQQSLAEALSVGVRTIKRWEAGISEIPQYADYYLDAMLERHLELIDRAVEQVENSQADSCTLTYYRTQDQFEDYGHNGYYGLANAVTREVAAILTEREMEVYFAYPTDADNTFHLAEFSETYSLYKTVEELELEADVTLDEAVSEYYESCLRAGEFDMKLNALIFIMQNDLNPNLLPAITQMLENEQD